MSKFKVAVVISQVIEKTEMIVGWVWLIFFSLMAFVCMFDKELEVGFKIFFWILALVAVPVISDGRRRKKLRLEYKKYVAHLSNSQTGSLDQMAAELGTSVDVVRENLEKMIKKKFLVNVYIDYRENRLVTASNAQNNAATASLEENAPDVEYVACTCKNCGGANRIPKGAVAECDYCGSSLP